MSRMLKPLVVNLMMDVGGEDESLPSGSTTRRTGVYGKGASRSRVLWRVYAAEVRVEVVVWQADSRSFGQGHGGIERSPSQPQQVDESSSSETGSVVLQLGLLDKFTSMGEKTMYVDSGETAYRACCCLSSPENTRPLTPSNVYRIRHKYMIDMRMYCHQACIGNRPPEHAANKHFIWRVMSYGNQSMPDEVRVLGGYDGSGVAAGLTTATSTWRDAGTKRR